MLCAVPLYRWLLQAQMAQMLSQSMMLQQGAALRGAPMPHTQRANVPGGSSGAGAGATASSHIAAQGNAAFRAKQYAKARRLSACAVAAAAAALAALSSSSMGAAVVVIVMAVWQAV